MILSKKYLDWFENTTDEEREAMLNHTISTFCSLKFLDRLLLAVGIVFGKKFYTWISRNQDKGD